MWCLGEILDTEDEVRDKTSKKKDSKATRKVERELVRKREAAAMAASLLEQWKVLKVKKCFEAYTLLNYKLMLAVDPILQY